MDKVISISLELKLSGEDAVLLENILGKHKQPATLGTICAAAAEEYVRMILGTRVFTRGSDIYEYRLFLLIKHAFEDGLPPEDLVCSYFQLTPTRARSLIQAVVAKYQYEIRDIVDSTLGRIVDSASEVEGEDYLTFLAESDVHVALLRERIRLLGAKQTQIRRTDKVGEYKILPSVRSALLKVLKHE